MVYGVIFLLLLVVAFIAFTQARGWQPQAYRDTLRTLGLPVAASFRAVPLGDTGVQRFDVTPARPPLRYTLFLTGATLLLFFLLTTLLSALWGMTGAIFGAVLAAVPSLWLWLPFGRAQLTRLPVKLEVSPAGIRLGAKNFPAQDIGQVYVRICMDAPSNVVIENNASTAKVQNLSRGLQRELAARSHLLTFRHRNNAQEEILAGGLTESCAEQLAEEVISALQHETKAPDAPPAARVMPQPDALDV